MPTILMILGWRFRFYANERDEPIHVHCKKGDAEAKFWLDPDAFDVSEAHAYNLVPPTGGPPAGSSSSISTILSASGASFRRSEMDKAHDVRNVSVSGSLLHLDVDGPTFGREDRN